MIIGNLVDVVDTSTTGAHAITQSFPLVKLGGHYFVHLDSGIWLIDTGAPTSFGVIPTVSIAGQSLTIAAAYAGLDAETLSRHVMVACAGLLGGDMLSRFDIVMNVPTDRITFSTGSLTLPGSTTPLDMFMGIPIVSARIGDDEHRMFFDTGAQISYLQTAARSGLPAIDQMTDFYPGFGTLQTNIYDVHMTVGANSGVLRCGVLPGLLGATLTMAGAHGIIGNQIIASGPVGYFPRRRALVLS